QRIYASAISFRRHPDPRGQEGVPDLRADTGSLLKVVKPRSCRFQAELRSRVYVRELCRNRKGLSLIMAFAAQTIVAGLSDLLGLCAGPLFNSPKAPDN